MLAFWKGEDAWGAAVFVLLTIGFAFAALILIWLGRLRAQRPLLVLRDSGAVAIMVVIAGVAGHLLCKAELRPTKERVEGLTEAITYYQRVHGALPESL